MVPWNETLSAVSEFNLLKAQSWKKKKNNNNNNNKTTKKQQQQPIKMSNSNNAN